MRLVIPILFVIAAIGLFFGYINPTYESVKILSADEGRYDEALDKSRELQHARDQLLGKYNAFSSEDITRLKKLLPDNVDNVRLILDLDAMASRYNMRIRDVAVSPGAAQVQGELGPSENLYSEFLLTFAVTATYENFLFFIQDLETSLRLVEITNVSFNESLADEYEFQVSIRTHWLE